MTVLDRELSTRITAEMPQVDAGRWLITVIASVFYVIGFVAARTVRIIVYVAMWTYTAVKLGWTEGLAKPVASPH